MADQDPTRRKDKRKAAEYEDGESSDARRVARELIRQYGGGDGIPGPGIPGQDAPLLVNHLMGQEHGGSSSRHGLQLQAPALGDSQKLQPMGSLPQSPLLPQYLAPAAASWVLQTQGEHWKTVWEVNDLCQDTTVRRQFQERDQRHKETHPSPVPEDQRCPTCHYYEKRVEDLPLRHDCPCAVCHVLYAVVCGTCLSALSSAPAGMGMGLPGQDQAAVQLGQPGLQPGQQARPVLPADQPVGLRRQTAPPRPTPHQHPQPPPPVGAGVQQPQNQLAVPIRPAGQHGEVPGGSAFQPWRPGFQPPPQAAHPVPKHLRCPFCRTRPGWLATRSPQHTCLCDTCRYDGVVCHVCASSQGGA